MIAGSTGIETGTLFKWFFLFFGSVSLASFIIMLFVSYASEHGTTNTEDNDSDPNIDTYV